MAREFFCAYHSFLKSVEPLNDAERGRLFTACLQYSETGIAPELRGNERFVFPTIREQIDRDKNNYAKICETNRNNRNGGQRPSTTVNETARNEQDKGKDKDKGKEEKENIARFWESAWKLYPEKKGKGQVSDTQKKRLYAVGLEELSRCIERYKSSKPDWQQYQNGSTFFNSGYVDYLDANYDSGKKGEESMPALAITATGRVIQD